MRQTLHCASFCPFCLLAADARGFEILGDRFVRRHFYPQFGRSCFFSANGYWTLNSKPRQPDFVKLDGNRAAPAAEYLWAEEPWARSLGADQRCPCTKKIKKKDRLHGTASRRPVPRISGRNRCRLKNTPALGNAQMAERRRVSSYTGAESDFPFIGSSFQLPHAGALFPSLPQANPLPDGGLASNAGL